MAESEGEREARIAGEFLDALLRQGRSGRLAAELTVAFVIARQRKSDEEPRDDWRG